MIFSFDRRPSASTRPMPRASAYPPSVASTVTTSPRISSGMILTRKPKSNIGRKIHAEPQNRRRHGIEGDAECRKNEEKVEELHDRRGAAQHFDIDPGDDPQPPPSRHAGEGDDEGKEECDARGDQRDFKRDR